MSKYLVKERSGKRSRLETIGCWDEVQRMILDGVSPSAIAKFVHEDRKEMTDIKRVSVLRSIQRWIGTAKVITVGDEDPGKLPQVSKAPQATMIATRALEWQRELEAELDQRFDALYEMAFVIKEQRKRLTTILGLEHNSGSLFPSASKEVKLLFMLLKQYMELCAELGIVPRAPQQYQHLVLGVQAEIGMAPKDISSLALLNADQVGLLLELEKTIGERSNGGDQAIEGEIIDAD